MVGFKFQNRIIRPICDTRLQQHFGLFCLFVCLILLELGFSESENYFLNNTEIGCFEYTV